MNSRVKKRAHFKKIQDKRRQFRIRIQVIFVGFFLTALFLIVRLYFVQIVHGEEYRIRAERQYVHTGQGFYDRGSIFFVNKDGKEISAATIKTGYILAIDPRRIKNPDKVYTLLNKIVPIDRGRFNRSVSKKNDPYEKLAKKLSLADADKIRALKLKGVHLVSERWRYYPGNDLAPQVLGFIAYDEHNKRVGRYGLERYYEDLLARNSNNAHINFFAELFANVRDIIFLPPEKREGDIITTIEPSVQLFLQNTLRDTRKKWNSEMVAGIIIEPKTGKIRAMAIEPGFDVNNFAKAPAGTYVNPLVSRVYEMGSIIKPLTVVAGVNEGLITAQSTYNDVGTLVIDGYKISNYDKRARGPHTTIQELISHSLNVGAVYVERKLGKKRFRKYISDFGLDEETGVDLPSEARNLLHNLNSKRDVEYATASFGQGIALTPISTVRALSALATGVLTQPHIVDKIRSRTGVVQDIDYTDADKQILKKESVEEISRMLVNAVDTALAGGRYKMEHYSIAAKTGTAQIAKPTGGYYDKDTLHTFFGYLPAYEPKYLVFLMNLRPHGAKYSSQTLPKTFFKIAKFLINYYTIPPDR